jgi:hypothetical protein
LMKGAVATTLLILRLPLPLLVPVTLCDGLVVPTATSPKARLVGATVNVAACASDGTARLIAKRRKKLGTETARRDDFGRAMINPPKKATPFVMSVCVTRPPAHSFPALRWRRPFRGGAIRFATQLPSFAPGHGSSEKDVPLAGVVGVVPVPTVHKAVAGLNSS